MATKMKSNILTMSLVLLVIAIISSGLLAYVYNLTKDKIAESDNLKKTQALSMVIPEFDNSPMEDCFQIASDGDSLMCYVGKKGDEIVGVAIETYTDKAFSGKFTVMVGFAPDGTIYNTMMLSHQETPGLGDKADKKKSNWSDQFNNKNPENFNLSVTKDGGNVDGITAATISSRAYCDAVDRAYKSFINEVKPKLGI